jgi:hypothetical protein
MACKHIAGRSQTRRELTRGNDNDNEQDDDAHNEAHAHLHVLPPHLLAHAVGASSKALRGRCEVVGLVLEGVETLAALCGPLDVLPHCLRGLLNFLDTSQYRDSRAALRRRKMRSWCATFAENVGGHTD